MRNVDQYVVGVLTPLTVIGIVALGRWIRQTMKLLEQVHRMAADTDRTVHAVDTAVNGRPKNEPTIYALASETAELGRKAAAEAADAARVGREAARVGREARTVGEKQGRAIIDLTESLIDHVHDDTRHITPEPKGSK